MLRRVGDFQFIRKIIVVSFKEDASVLISEAPRETGVESGEDGVIRGKDVVLVVVFVSKNFALAPALEHALAFLQLAFLEPPKSNVEGLSLFTEHLLRIKKILARELVASQGLRKVSWNVEKTVVRGAARDFGDKFHYTFVILSSFQMSHVRRTEPRPVNPADPRLKTKCHLRRETENERDI